MGSSLTVTPAADVPAFAGANPSADLVIVNLQNTPLTESATMQIYAKTDTVAKKLMERLGAPIPKWLLRRRIEARVTPVPVRGGRVASVLKVRAVDMEDASLP